MTKTILYRKKWSPSNKRNAEKRCTPSTKIIANILNFNPPPKKQKFKYNHFTYTTTY